MTDRSLWKRIFRVVLLVSLIVCSGCLGQSEECPKPVTPSSYPEWPDTLTNQSVSSFVSDIERTYIHNRAVSASRLTNISFNPIPDNITRLDDGYLVRFSTGYTVTACKDGSLSDGVAAYSARYFINDSVVYRVEMDGPNDPALPREQGTQLTLD